MLQQIRMAGSRKLHCSIRPELNGRNGPGALVRSSPTQRAESSPTACRMAPAGNR